MTTASRTFLVAGAEDSWFITTKGWTSRCLANQQQAIDVALALAAREGAYVTWSDDYTGTHTVAPARDGWFSDSMRAARAAPPVAALLS
jgi:hypothetical protein